MLRYGFCSKTIYVIFAVLLVAGCGSTSKPKLHSIVGSDAPNSTTSTTSATSDTGTTTDGASAKDVVPPDTSLVSGPNGLVNNNSASFTFTGTDDVKVAGFACRLDGASWASCSSPKTYSGLADGVRTFNVRAIDAAGNTDASPATRTWTVDSIPPDTSFVSGASGPVSRTSNSFVFSCNEGGCSYQCALNGGTFAGCSTPYAFAGQTDATYTLQVRATDAANNTDPTPATRTWTVDSIPPDTSIVSGASGLVSSTSNSFVFSCNEGGCSYQCALNGGVFAGCITPYAFAGQTDATYTLQVRATDAAGNTDASPVGVSWTVDGTPPIVTISDGPASTTSTTTATDAHFVFACNEAGCATWCAMDGVTATSCTSPKDVTGLTTNLHTFAVTAVDLAGNATTSVTSQTWRVITVPESYWQPISGGTFSMGDALDGLNDAPPHDVTISTLGMMKYEVTNGTYADCVAASRCTAPGVTASTYGYGSTTGDDPYRPVVYVNWSQATAYCSWAGGRLPTEAQWEYAARGGLGGKRFPWGDTIDCSKANYYSTSSCVGDTSRVGNYAANNYGLYDMAGNVFDWVNDWYSNTYYSSSPGINPQGPATGSNRVVRGGDWSGSADDARVAFRGNNTPTLQTYSLGFRCVRPLGLLLNWLNTIIDSGPSLVTDATSVTFAFSGSGVVDHFECHLDAAAWTTCTSPVSYSLTQQATHTFGVRAVDVVGNVDASPATASWTLDFSDNDDGTITDNVTHLMWQNQDSGLRDWQSALYYCSALGLGGHTDWNLPDKDTLIGLYNNLAQRAGGSSDHEVLPFEWPGDFFWSSSASASNAWALYFVNGASGNLDKNHGFNARCVR